MEGLKEEVLIGENGMRKIQIEDEKICASIQ